MNYAIRAEVQHASRAPRIPAEQAFRAWAQAPECAEAVTVCIRIVDEPEMASLNQRFRKRGGPTDVLAFPADSTERRHGHLGDVVICAPEVLRMAQEADRPADTRFAQVTVHGVLHLLGHDHTKEDERRIMEAAESSVLQRLGYPDPYGGGA